MIPMHYIHTKYFNEKYWLLLFFQNVTKREDFITEYSEFLFVNKKEKFSIFNYVHQDKNNFTTNDFYEFLLEYPSLGGYNQWKQSIFPLDANESQSDQTVGFDAQESNLTWTSQFRGLIISSRSEYTFLDGAVGYDDWWFTIGAKTNYRSYPLAFPGPCLDGSGGERYTVQTVFLWIHIPQSRLQKLISSFTYNVKKSPYFKIHPTLIM